MFQAHELWVIRQEEYRNRSGVLRCVMFLFIHYPSIHPSIHLYFVIMHLQEIVFEWTMNYLSDCTSHSLSPTLPAPPLFASGHHAFWFKIGAIVRAEEHHSLFLSGPKLRSDSICS